jgi:hypothetical protein
MENRNRRSGGPWAAVLLAGAAVLCCGGHVLLSLGGLSVLAAWPADWEWLATGGIVLGSLGMVLHRRRAKEGTFAQRETGGGSRPCAG